MKYGSTAVSVFIIMGMIIVPDAVAETAARNVSSPPWGQLIIGVAGGLAFFLYGMGKMSGGMKKAAGNKIRTILSSLTQNRVIALIVGAFVTMVIQSSSATTVMLVSFVQAGLLTFVQSLGVILGADIGTTITAQMIAFKLTDYALLMVAIGFAVKLFGKKQQSQAIGEIVMGFGILFFGMKLMSDVMTPLRTYPFFIDMMKDLEHPLMGLVVGTVFTAVVQSSSATTGVLIVLAQQGLISLEAGIPVILGANVGTCVTAGLAGIGACREAKRVALAHVMFKLVGVALFIFWIPHFSEFIRMISAFFGSGPARQLANAHTIFNVSIGLLFLPFVHLFASAINKILPDIKSPRSFEITTRYIDPSILKTPSLAIELARTEMARMALLLNRMLKAIIIPFLSDEQHILKQEKSGDDIEYLVREIPKQDEIFSELTLLEGIDLRERKLDYLEEQVSQYLTRIAQGEINSEQAGEVFGMVSIVKDMESMADIIHRNMIPLIAKKKNLEFDFSSEGKEELLIYHSKVTKQINRLRQAFLEPDPQIAHQIMEKERRYLDLESKYRARHLKRIVLKNEESVQTTEIHLELMDLMKQLVLYSANIAQTYVGKTPVSDQNLHMTEMK
jgi:phosphate:Na+ symporter